MPKFRKKPVVIEAEIFAGFPSLVTGVRQARALGRCPQCLGDASEHGTIDTLEGTMTACPGDWIITGVKGERYPCKPDIFAATYEPAE